MFFSKVVLFAISLGAISESVLATPHDHALHHRAVAARTLTPSNSPHTDVAVKRQSDSTIQTVNQIADAIHFIPNVTNCDGITFSRPIDLVVSLSRDLFDKGGFCGKQVTITSLGLRTNATATVVDECQNCTSGTTFGLSDGVVTALGAEEVEFPIKISFFFL